jgi:hypothetical protein
LFGDLQLEKGQLTRIARLAKLGAVWLSICLHLPLFCLVLIRFAAILVPSLDMVTLQAWRPWLVGSRVGDFWVAVDKRIHVCFFFKQYVVCAAVGCVPESAAAVIQHQHTPRDGWLHVRNVCRNRLPSNRAATGQRVVLQAA